MLKEVTLKFSDSTELKVPAGGVTIFVGPNNSGKSLVLRELSQAVAGASLPLKIVQDFELTWKSPAEFDAEIAPFSSKPLTDEGSIVEVMNFNPNGDRRDARIQASSLRHEHAKRSIWVSEQYFQNFQLLLDGRTRFNLTNDRTSGDLLAPAHNPLAHIFKEDPLRKRIRDILHRAFNVYFVIDPTWNGNLRIRFSTTPPGFDEQSLSQEARTFHSKAIHIKEAGDGIQAFTGILIAVLSGNYRSILIDEPEAFLHPPLAKKLGYELTTIAAQDGGSLLASTHSADFLLGCLQASANVRVVRLEYAHGKSKGRIVDSTALTNFFRKPLIRSANVLSALFHDGVVVTESDNDRAFYSEISQRLAEKDKSFPSILFVNAQNKQTLREILGPLRKFGVPAAAIADIDILKMTGTDWTGLLTQAQIPSGLHNGLGQMRGELVKRFAELNQDMKKQGIDSLPANEKQTAETLFDLLSEYGIFAVRRGELEKWLPHLNVTGAKTEWTVSMLEKLGADPNIPSYQLPSGNDVWAFITQVAKWIRDPARKGVT